MLRRVFLILGAIVTASCAGNTLRQDLVYTAWDKCQAEGRIPSQVILTRVDLDGRYWIQGLAGSYGFGDTQTCISEQVAKMGQAPPPGLSSAPAAPVAPAVLAAQVAAPTWKPGDEWAFSYDSPSGKGTYVWAVDREEAVAGVPHYVIRAGTREIFYRKSDLAMTLETVNGAPVLKVAPSRLAYVWPLSVGQTWQQAVHEERPGARQTAEREDVVTVEAEETVTVPAGTFRTLKIVYRNKGTGAIRYEAWYAPELKQLVQLRERLEAGLRTRELIAYKLR
jgi:hypothetical protein